MGDKSNEDSAFERTPYPDKSNHKEITDFTIMSIDSNDYEGVSDESDTQSQVASEVTGKVDSGSRSKKAPALNYAQLTIMTDMLLVKTRSTYYGNMDTAGNSKTAAEDIQVLTTWNKNVNLFQIL